MTQLDASVLFVVGGPENGTWLVQLAPPEPAVIPITQNHDVGAMLHSRNLQINITTGEMEKLLDGAFDARKALVEGNVEVTGDLALLRNFLNCSGRATLCGKAK